MRITQIVPPENTPFLSIELTKKEVIDLLFTLHYYVVNPNVVNLRNELSTYINQKGTTNEKSK